MDAQQGDQDANLKRESQPQSTSHVEISLDLMPGERIQVTIESLPDAGGEPQYTAHVERTPAGETAAVEGKAAAPAAAAGAVKKTPWISFPPLPKSLGKIGQFFEALPSRAGVLLGIALGIYFLTRLVGLADFPIYFYCDEAANTVIAANLANNQLRDADGALLPTFFRNPDKYSLGTSVYLQVLPYLFFGKSIWVTRGISMLVTLLAVLWVAWILRDGFKLKWWWVGVLVLGSIPGWFLLSRTAYEAPLMVTLYAGFLYYYLKYREDRPEYLYVSLILGALAFYAYTPGEVVVVLTGIILFFTHLRYHWKQRITAMRGFGLLILLALPLIRFIVEHPGEYALRLSMYGSYLAGSQSALAKAGTYVLQYLAGLNPFYWFNPGNPDLPIYTMKGYGHVHWLLLPFVAVGLVRVVRRWREPASHLTLAALFASPAGAAFVGPNLTRAAMIFVPITLLAGVGISYLLEKLVAWRPSIHPALPVYLALVLFGAASFYMLGDALIHGPTWFKQYGLDGMQYGARQVFSAAQAYVAQNPETTLFITPNWSFQTEVLRDFFVPGESRIQIGTADRYMNLYDINLEKYSFVLTPTDYHAAQQSGKFKDIQVDRTLPYPDGEPGFYFVRLAYREGVEKIFEEEKVRLFELQVGEVIMGGGKVKVRHTALDMGTVDALFDGNMDTLARTAGLNPFIVELEFPETWQMKGVSLRVGSEKVLVTATIDPGNGQKVESYSRGMEESSGFKDVTVDFGGVKNVKTIRIEMLDALAPERSNVHLWEITLNQ